MKTPRGVKVTSRETPGTMFHFLLNLTETRSEVLLRRPMDELVGEQERITAVTLTPAKVRVPAGPADARRFAE